MLSKWPNQSLPALPVISTLTLESLGADAGQNVNSYGSSAYQAANRALFFPFHLEEPITVTLLFCMNGAIASGNVDMGIYDVSFRRLVSKGSAAQVGTNVIQTFDITDTLIGPGDYYLAIAMDNITGTLFLVNLTTVNAQRVGILAQASAFPLPAIATPVTAPTGVCALVGLRQGGTII